MAATELRPMAAHTVESARFHPASTARSWCGPAEARQVIGLVGRGRKP